LRKSVGGHVKQEPVRENQKNNRPERVRVSPSRAT
jgi:hypothetical protein